jgi:hypothetical protein
MFLRSYKLNKKLPHCEILLIYSFTISLLYKAKITLMYLSSLDMSLNTSLTAESALTFATTHKQPFPLPALQSVTSVARTDGLSQDVNLQYDSARYVPVLYWDFLDNSLCCLNK